VPETTLGPFHTELLKFLKSEPERGRLLPLTEIFDQVQHVFGSKIHLEKSLLEAMPPKEFIQEGLSRYYPRIYRGLPRLYSKENPSLSQIKKNFSHLPSLKKEAVAKAVYSLYGKVPAKGKVVLFTWVMGDGLGDYVAAVEVFRILKGKFPNLHLKMIALVQQGRLANVSAPEGSFLIPYEKEAPFSLLTSEAMEELKGADFVLQLPTYYPETEKIRELAPSMATVGEYGFVESSWFHPKSGNCSLGLHFLEKGVLTRKPFKASWDEVKNIDLQNWRREDNHFYLAYLTSPIGGAIYLHALLKSLETDPTDIDLCVPDLGWLIKWMEKKGNRPLLEWELGVGSLEVYFQDKIFALPTGKGKKVRFLCPQSISQSDFRALLSLSGDWVAVRGNQSFSEVISQGKPFFFDGREHARYFLKDLVALAENRIGGYPGALACFRGMHQGFLYNLPPEKGEWVEETHFQELEEWTSVALSMGMSLQEPETLSGFQKFNQIIAEEFSANQFLCHLVQRGLFQSRFPSLAKKEGEELELFADGKQGFGELIEHIKDLVEKGEDRYGSI
jgi:hypothetical protein